MLFLRGLLAKKTMQNPAQVLFKLIHETSFLFLSTLTIIISKKANFHDRKLLLDPISAYFVRFNLFN